MRNVIYPVFSVGCRRFCCSGPAYDEGWSCYWGGLLHRRVPDDDYRDTWRSVLLCAT